MRYQSCSLFTFWLKKSAEYCSPYNWIFSVDSIWYFRPFFEGNRRLSCQVNMISIAQVFKENVSWQLSFTGIIFYALFNFMRQRRKFKLLAGNANVKNHVKSGHLMILIFKWWWKLCTNEAYVATKTFFHELIF